MGRLNRIQLSPSQGDQMVPQVTVLKETAPADWGSVRIICGSCDTDFHPPEYRYKFHHASHRVTPRLESQVVLERTTFILIERDGNREIERETNAFIGQCERCKHTYIMHTR